MKKLLLMMCAIFAFTSCEKPNAGEKELPPVDGIELPDATTPIEAGADVTIKGKGFTAASEIWLNAATKADPTLIKAEIVSFTETSITFKVPATVEGKCAVILKQDGKEYPLGELTFEAPAAGKEAKLFGIGLNWNNQTAISSIDLTAGSTAEFKVFDQGSYLDNAVVIGRKVYGINLKNDHYPTALGDTSLVSFDFDTQTYTKIKKLSDGYGEIMRLGVIDNTLHVLTLMGRRLPVLWSFDPETAGFKQVCAFEGDLFDYRESYESSCYVDTPFLYDTKNKNIISLNSYGEAIALNMEKKTQTRLPSFEKYWAGAFWQGDQMYVLLWDTTETGLYTLNDKYELGSKITTIQDNVISCQYDAGKDVLYMIRDPYENGVKNGVCTFDFKNSALKQPVKECEFDNLILVQ